jgi:hypothetical protein
MAARPADRWWRGRSRSVGDDEAAAAATAVDDGDGDGDGGGAEIGGVLLLLDGCGSYRS